MFKKSMILSQEVLENYSSVRGSLEKNPYKIRDFKSEGPRKYFLQNP